MIVCSSAQVLSCILHHSRNHEGGKGLTLCGTRSADGGRTWSALRPVEEPETERDRRAYGVQPGGKEGEGARQSHDGYQGGNSIAFIGQSKSIPILA